MGNGNLRSTERTATDEIFPNPILQEDDAQSFHDDKSPSGGSDTIVPEVLESENDDMIVENERKKENTTYDVTPPPTSLMNTDISQIHLLLVPIYYIDSETNLTLDSTTT